MKTVAYASYEDKTCKGINMCSRHSEALPLVLNCAGVMALPFSFDTDNRIGRLDYYLLFVTEGEITVWLPEGKTVLRAGSAVFFPPHYRYRYGKASDEYSEYLWVHFTGSCAGELLDSLGFGTLPAVCETGHVSRMKVLFGKLFDAYIEGGRLMQHQLAAVLYDILLHLGKAADFANQSAGNRLTKSLRYIYSSFDGDIRVPALAAMENLSVSRYNTLFREVTGTSPVKYLLGLRMNAACNLLLSTDLPARQVGEMVGYGDSRFFGKVFKSYVGVTPTEYRKNPQK